MGRKHISDNIRLILLLIVDVLIRRSTYELWSCLLLHKVLLLMLVLRGVIRHVLYGRTVCLLWQILFRLLLWLHESVGMARLYHNEHTLAFLRNEASDDFLSHILSWVVQEFLQLQTWETLNNLILAANGRRVLLIELFNSALLLKHVFYEASTSICHLT